MTDISFDCGSKNFAYCVCDRAAGSISIVEWRCAELCTARDPIERLVECAARELCGITSRHPLLRRVYVEQQPSRNLRMKCLSHVIQAHFVGGAGVHVAFVRPKNVHVFWYGAEASRAKLSYHKRKRRSERTALEYLQRASIKWHSLLETAEKKDDLADSLLQLLSVALPHRPLGTMSSSSPPPPLRLPPQPLQPL